MIRIFLFLFAFWFLCFPIFTFLFLDFFYFLLFESIKLELDSELSVNAELNVKELDNNDKLWYFYFSRLFYFRSSPSLIFSKIFGFVWYTCLLGRIPVFWEGSLSNWRPGILFWCSKYCLFQKSEYCFFVTIVKSIVSYWFLKTFFEDVFIVYDPLPISFFVWNGFWITLVSIKVGRRPKLDRVWLYIKKLDPKCTIVVGRYIISLFFKICY